MDYNPKPYGDSLQVDDINLMYRDLSNLLVLVLKT